MTTGLTPTLIVGGYLGAGKTTLVNHLLRHAGGRRIAVMVNDFGELTIDADLIEGADGSVLALAGGCVCCSFGSDLIGALQDMLQRQPPPDLILIETSGVALPAAVARSARLLPGLCIEGIVLMLDAETVRQRSADPYVGDLVRQQLLDADLLILNKTELCSPTALAELNAWLPTMTTPGTPVVPANQARVPPELVLGFHAGLSTGPDTTTGDALARWVAQPIAQPLAPASDRFVNELLALSAPLDPQALLQGLSDPTAGIVRAKGWLTDLAGQRYLLQQVGRRIELLPLAPDVAPSGPDRLLVIGLVGIYRPGHLLLNQ
ncbi:cobalamin biosynthesis protein CobW [Comamonadaceae bacterium]|nr:cobalamin biosynthesis protein CobW [Comamonadaceae bacterium]